MNDASARAVADAAAETLQGLGAAPDRSVHPEAATLAAPSLPVRMPTLQEVAVAVAGSESHADLVMLRVLGQGGMGIVELARQRSLDREVAIKRVRDGAANANGAVALLHEAATTGSLEHPSIVPVHALGRDRDGAPLMVMKKIEGVSLRALTEDPEHPHWREGDRLARVVSIVARLCDAVAFAHSRGVIHRDIKPENVMLGEFGEIYLLDWGIAIKRGQTLPKGAIAGTPAYMAPEMLEPDSGRIGERSDVFLLGATLHEAIVGAPPYSGDSLPQILYAVVLAEPRSYGEEVPAELASILRCAMHRDPEQRYASALELQRALEGYLTHRAAAALVRVARDRLQALERASSDRGATAEVHTLFNECRFAFEQAAREWPDDEEARAGKQRCLEVMFRWEIAHENRDAAAALLEALGSPEALAAELAELERRLSAAAEERARLARLDEEMNVDAGERQRTSALRILGGILAVLTVSFSTAILSGVLRPTPRTLLFMSALGLPILATIAWRVRKALFVNRINRQFALTLAATGAIVMVHRAAGIAGGDSLAEVASGDAFIAAAGLAAVALSIRRVYLVGTILFTIASVVVRLVPQASVVPLLAAGMLTLSIVLASPRSLRKPLITTANRPPAT